jgi:hypothetical protein
MGYAASRIYLPLCYIFPETSTEMPMLIGPKVAQPIVLTLGQNVVVISVDFEGEMTLVRECRVIIACQYPLEATQACVLLPSKQALNNYRYFEEKSHCLQFNGMLMVCAFITSLIYKLTPFPPKASFCIIFTIM